MDAAQEGLSGVGPAPLRPHVKIADKRRAWRRRLFDAQQGLCIWCNKPMSLTARKQAEYRRGQPARNFATFEHLTPRRDGGSGGFRAQKQSDPSDDDPNVALAHEKCNRRRDWKAKVNRLTSGTSG